MPKPLKSQLVFSVLMIACYLLSNSQHCQFVRAQNSASTSKNSKDFVIKGRCLKYDLESRPDGQIVNAKVTLFTHRGLSMEMKQLQQTSTDDEGRFVFDPVAEPSGNRFTRRSYALKVETDGYMAFAHWGTRLPPRSLMVCSVWRVFLRSALNRRWSNVVS